MHIELNLQPILNLIAVYTLMVWAYKAITFKSRRAKAAAERAAQRQAQLREQASRKKVVHNTAKLGNKLSTSVKDFVKDLLSDVEDEQAKPQAAQPQPQSQRAPAPELSFMLDRGEHKIALYQEFAWFSHDRVNTKVHTIEEFKAHLRQMRKFIRQDEYETLVAEFSKLQRQGYWRK